VELDKPKIWTDGKLSGDRLEKSKLESCVLGENSAIIAVDSGSLNETRIRVLIWITKIESEHFCGEKGLWNEEFSMENGKVNHIAPHQCWTEYLKSDAHTERDHVDLEQERDND
jgi:hypothetical protein